MSNAVKMQGLVQRIAERNYFVNLAVQNVSVCEFFHVKFEAVFKAVL